MTPHSDVKKQHPSVALCQEEEVEEEEEEEEVRESNLAVEGEEEVDCPSTSD
jgi:hypothetical protein